MNISSSFKKITQKARFRFPSRLPVGRPAFDDFCTSIFSTYDFPQKEEYINAIANLIMHLGPTTDKKAKYFFVRSIRTASAKQVAFDVLSEIRKAEKLRQEEQSQKETTSCEKPLQNT